MPEPARLQSIDAIGRRTPLIERRKHSVVITSRPYQIGSKCGTAFSRNTMTG